MSVKDKNLLLAFNPLAIWAPHFEVDLELIQKHLDKGWPVVVLYCDGALFTCEANILHDQIICAMCKSRFNAGIRWLKGEGVEIAPLVNLKKREDLAIKKLLFVSWDRFEDVRSFKIDNVDIGLAAASSVITILRDTNPDVNLHQELIAKHIASAALVYYSLMNHLAKYKPIKLQLFNGRLASIRPAMRAAQLQNISFEVHERASDIDRYNIFRNTYPHSLEANKSKIDETYLKLNYQDSVAWEITQSWFEERRKGVDQVWPSLVKDQKKGLLPRSLTDKTINIVIFNSSDDEYAASDEWSNSFHSDQAETISHIMRYVESNDRFKVFLRVHPILRGINNTQTRGIEKLGKDFSGLNIISADSKIDSYSLIEVANLVITFGSTVGIEAAYLGKTSILVGHSLYEDLDVVLHPKSISELIETLDRIKNGFDYPAPIGRRIGLIKYVLYSLYHGEKLTYVQPIDLFRARMKRGKELTNIKANIIIRIIAKYKMLSSFLLKNLKK